MKSTLLTIALVTLLGAVQATFAKVAEEPLTELPLDTIQLISDRWRKDGRDALRALGAESETDLQRQIFAYNADLYSNWTEWGDCSRYSCKQLRFRRCVDDSFTKRVANPRRRNFCPFKFIREERRCPNASECLENAGPSETLQRLSLTCGIRPATEAAQSGGRAVKRNMWPWHVKLYKVKLAEDEVEEDDAENNDDDDADDDEESSGQPVESGQQLVCGGSLLSPSWIVTSAHCLRPILQSKAVPVGVPFNFSGLVVRVGGQPRAQKESPGSEYRVESAVIHPEWYPRFHGQSGFDIALLKLAVPVSPDEAGVDTICLADANTTLSKKDKCYVVSWGDAGAISPCPTKGILRRRRLELLGIHYASFGCRHNRFLRQRKAAGMAPSLAEAKVTLTSPKKCTRWPLNPDKEHLICAGRVGKAACTSDNGSGLYCHNAETDRWFLHGVIGQYWGNRCSESHRLFSSVSSVAAWIHQHIR
ncbi:hypothetical protein SprV_0602158000 [Sparganum proliferum]